MQLVPVYRRLLGDTLTPVSAFHKIDSGPTACLFESVIGGEKVGRYSFLAADPFLADRSPRQSRSRSSRPAAREEFTAADPLAELQERASKRFARPRLPELPPFTSGAVGYAGYDVIRYTEHLPNAPANDRQLPDLAFAFYDHMVVFDHVNKTNVVVAMARLDKFGARPGGRLRRRPAARSTRSSTQLERPDANLPPADIDTGGQPTIAYQSNFTQADFERAVEKCVEYIRAGDIFQVVISQRLRTGRSTASRSKSIARCAW